MDIIASDMTKQLMAQLSRSRLKESMDSVPPQIDDLQSRLVKAKLQRYGERYGLLKKKCRQRA